MALITLPTAQNPPSIITPDADTRIVGKGYALNNIQAGTPCYFDTNGRVIPYVATSGFLVPCVGWTASSANAGEMVTLVSNVTFSYETASLLNNGVYLYGSATAGQLDDTQILGCPPIARVILGNPTITNNTTTFSTNFRKTIHVYTKL